MTEKLADMVASARSTVPEVAPADAQAGLERGEIGLVLDVREHDEFEAGHLPGAVNIPLKTLDAESTASLDPRKPVIVYCYDSL